MHQNTAPMTAGRGITVCNGVSLERSPDKHRRKRASPWRRHIRFWRSSTVLGALHKFGGFRE
jgi:hypothetical protein